MPVRYFSNFFKYPKKMNNLYTFIKSLIFLVFFPTLLQAQWTQLITPASFNINSIYFSDSLNGWIGGNQDNLYKTTDGGNNWVQQTLPTTGTVFNIHFINKDTGWLAQSDRIYHTKDGGANWSEQNSTLNDGGPAFWLITKIMFTNNSVGYAVAYINAPGNTNGRILKTSNAGSTWTDITPSRMAQDKKNLLNLHFFTPDTGFVTGSDGYILYTNDGGNSWFTVDPGTSSHLFGVSFIDRYTGWLSGQNGTILKTTDGGLTWSFQISNSMAILTSIKALDSLHAWAVGFAGTVLRTADGGNSWHPQQVSTNNNLRNVVFPTNTTGYISGENNTLFKTTNGGGDPGNLPDLKLTNPKGGEDLNPGDTFYITWTSKNVDKINIDFDAKWGLFQPVAGNVDASTGSYAWIVPNTLTTEGKIRITDVDRSYLMDVNEFNFYIGGAPSITLTNPKGGEVLKTGVPFTITWTSTNIDKVKIEFDPAGGAFQQIATNVTASTGSYSWTVPKIATTQGKIRISSMSQGSIFDINTSGFTIDTTTTSVRKNRPDNETIIFPIPVKNSFTLKTDLQLPAYIIIYDSKGRIIINDQVTDNATPVFDLKPFAPGIYYVRLFNENYSWSTKILKE
jgi:photosystem II stability/assembly factor-like uncharacterized protein